MRDDADSAGHAHLLDFIRLAQADWPEIISHPARYGGALDDEGER